MKLPDTEIHGWYYLTRADLLKYISKKSFDLFYLFFKFLSFVSIKLTSYYHFHSYQHNLLKNLAIVKRSIIPVKHNYFHQYDDGDKVVFYLHL